MQIHNRLILLHHNFKHGMNIISILAVCLIPFIACQKNSTEKNSEQPQDNKKNIAQPISSNAPSQKPTRPPHANMVTLPWAEAVFERVQSLANSPAPSPSSINQETLQNDSLEQLWSRLDQLQVTYTEWELIQLYKRASIIDNNNLRSPQALSLLAAGLVKHAPPLEASQRLIDAAAILLLTPKDAADTTEQAVRAWIWAQSGQNVQATKLIELLGTQKLSAQATRYKLSAQWQLDTITDEQNEEAQLWIKQHPTSSHAFVVEYIEALLNAGMYRNAFYSVQGFSNTLTTATQKSAMFAFLQEWIQRKMPLTSNGDAEEALKKRVDSLPSTQQPRAQKWLMRFKERNIDWELARITYAYRHEGKKLAQEEIQARLDGDKKKYLRGTVLPFDGNPSLYAAAAVILQDTVLARRALVGPTGKLWIQTPSTQKEMLSILSRAKDAASKKTIQMFTKHEDKSVQEVAQQALKGPLSNTVTSSSKNEHNHSGAMEHAQHDH